MNEIATIPNKLETVVCSRCGGTGQYSFNLMTGSVCFKCGGGKHVFTQRGRVAHDFLQAIRSRPAESVKVGDLVQVRILSMCGNATSYKFERVIRSGICTNGGGYDAEKCQVLWVIETKSLTNHLEWGSPVRLGLTMESKSATWCHAMKYQATLTKRGLPTKATEAFLAATPAPALVIVPPAQPAVIESVIG